MSNNSISSDLELLRKLLSEENFNPDFAFEFFSNPKKIEAQKNELKKKFNNKCCFFIKEKNDKLHVIVIVNISIEKLVTQSKISDLLEQKHLKQSSFDPNLISFFKK